MSDQELLLLQGAADRLTAYLNSAPSLVERSITEPASGSRLAAEISDEDLFTPTSIAAVYLSGALEHFGLIHQGMSSRALAVIALTTVVRGAFEGSARALWLLDPSVSTSERIERGLLERCAGIVSAQKVNPDPSLLASRAASIQAVAARHNISLAGQLDRSKLPRKVGGNDRPTMTRLAEEALLALDSRRTDGDVQAGTDERWFYAWLSAVAHSAGWALFNQKTLARDKAGNPTVQIAGNAGNLAGAVDLTRHVHRLAVQRLAHLAGYGFPVAQGR